MSIARFSRADMERIARDIVASERAMRGNPTPERDNPPSTKSLDVGVDRLINSLIGHESHFYESEERNFPNDKKYNVGLSLSLQDASAYAVANNGLVASMPLLIAGKSKAEPDNYLWNNWFSCLSEELVGVDEHGVLASKGEPLVVVVHGKGILTGGYNRIMKAYSDELDNGWGKISNAEFAGVLNGELPGGRRLSGVYTVQDVIDGKVKNPLSSIYAVWLPLATAQSVASGYLGKPAFTNSHLVIARAGTLEYLDSYFSKAVSFRTNKNIKTVSNYHSLAGLNAEALKLQPRGRVLFVFDNCGGLLGNVNLNYDGCFVGVALEAP